jgi:phytoene synthase
MDIDELHRLIFRQGSRTYYNSTKLFPKAVRRDVFTLYAFVRVADNLVDDQPVDADEFYAFRQRWRDACAGKPAGDWVIDPFVELSRRKEFDPQWVEEFLFAMESDLTARPNNTIDDVTRYTWGSAEVIGLFMLKLLGIGDEAKETACLMGRSMQFINFLRDVAEDAGIGRRYLPLGDSGLKDLSRETAEADPEAFRRFLRSHTALYSQWQQGARAGYAYLPWRFRLAIKTASDLYNWTATVIQADPMVVWKRKVKPGRLRIFATAFGNLFYRPPKPTSRRAS